MSAAPEMRVADIKVGGQDSAGIDILEVYARQPPTYAVYRTAERVAVEYGDEKSVEKSQRLIVARLNPLRSSINSLIDGWKATNSYGERRLRKYNRRVADALVLAFEQDIVSSELLLYETRQDILEERKATAKLYYLAAALTTFGVSLLVIYVLTLIKSDGNYFFGWPKETEEMWVGADAGALGALFSIVSGIQSKDVLPDIEWIYNSVDSVLRVTVGVVAGIILICFLESGIVSLSIGNVDKASWYYVFIGGFLAGFSERLIPDLLSKTLNNADPTKQGLKPGVPITGTALAAAQNLTAANPQAEAANPANAEQNGAGQPESAPNQGQVETDQGPGDQEQKAAGADNSPISEGPKAEAAAAVTDGGEEAESAEDPEAKKPAS